jgi:hypothetical protein
MAQLITKVDDVANVQGSVVIRGGDPDPGERTLAQARVASPGGEG